MKHFDLIIVPSTTDGVRRWRVPQPAVVAGLAVIALAVCATVGAWIWAGMTHVAVGDLEELREENAYLAGRLDVLTGQIDRIGTELAYLEDAEQRVRLVFGFPEVDPAERELGIGGFPIADASSSPLVASTHGQEAALDRLLRRCAFERENFEEIYGRLLNYRDRLDHTPSILPARGRISRGFGMKPNPFTGAVQPHNGLDIAGSAGTPVVAAADGVVESANWQRKLGKLVVIDHGFGYKTRYGHLSKFTVRIGERVRRGDPIGRIGSTGYSTGPHLHYEILRDRSPQNPMNYIYDRTFFYGSKVARRAEQS